MNVLVACEESQEVCKAFRAKGHNAFSCDLQPCSGGHPEWHIMQDVLPLLNGHCMFTTINDELHVIEEWNLIIAHPPCTYMCKASAKHMYPQPGIIDQLRYREAVKARKLFMMFYNLENVKVCIENPTPLKCVMLPKETQAIQPYQFGDPYTKRTCLWLKNLQPLVPTNIVEPLAPYVPSFTSRKLHEKYGAAKRGDDSKNRSKTFPGIAQAMADQWG